ncbi:MAG TPA: DUF6350 family protein [Nocardioidaceae bacterium]|nr:DUF6350 family protein [Nocardioidaceae bacterium]
MTGLLVPPSTSRSASPGEGSRPLVIGAVLAGAAAAATVLVGCMATALVAWFSTDQGSHGTTKDALRIGSDAWLLAHGASLDVGVAVVTLIPLGLTLLCGYVCFRLGRWAATTSAVEDLRTLGLAVLVLAAVYGLVSLVVALLASIPSAEPHLGRAFVGGFAVAALGGGPGLAAGAGQLHPMLARLPESVRAVLRGASVAALATFAAGGVLVAAALVLDLGEAANVLSALHAEGAAGAFMTVLVAGFAPNAALFGSSYLVGPGFTVGTGTVVSTGDVSLGPVPAFPLLAALPGDGPAPWWAMLFLAVPVLFGGLAGWSATRAYPSHGYDAAALRGLGAGAGGGVLLGVALSLAGGAVGPGRMEDVGPAVVSSTLAAVVSLGLGGTLGAVVTHWRLGPAPDGTEPTVDLNALGIDTQPDSDADEPTVGLAPGLLSRLRPRRD